MDLWWLLPVPPRASAKAAVGDFDRARRRFTDAGCCCCDDEVCVSPPRANAVAELGDLDRDRLTGEEEEEEAAVDDTPLLVLVLVLVLVLLACKVLRRPPRPLTLL